MKILTVVDKLTLGGTERVAQTCALGYKAAGFSSAVLALHGGGIREKSLKEKNVELFLGGKDPHKIHEAVDAASSWEPDIVHIHRTGYPNELSGGVLRSLANRKPKIIETNVFARYDNTQDGDLIDLHIVLSEWCLWKYQRWARCKKPNPIAVTIPNPVDSTNFYPLSEIERIDARRNWDIPNDAFVLGRIGQPNQFKWSDSIINAFKVTAENYHNAYLVLVGAPPLYQEHINKLPLLIRSRVKFIPPQEDDNKLRLLYGSFDVFLHASRIGESFGMVLCESMLCGVPVITLATPLKDNSQVEVVSHMKSGLVVLDERSMVDAITCLITDKFLLSELSSQAREWVLNKFDVSVVMPKLLYCLDVVHRSSGRAELRVKLNQVSIFPRIPSLEELILTLEKSIGWLPWHTKFVMNLIHIPWIYHLWRFLKTKSSIINL